MNQDHVIDPEDFLNRSQDRADITRRLKEGRNILLYGPRRIGKTSLVKRLAHDLRNDMTILRLDCNFLTDPEDLASAIFKAVGNSGIAKWKTFKQKVTDYVKGLEVSLEVAPDGTMTPTIKPGQTPERALESTLEFLARVAKDAKHPVVLSLDEFQVIMEWEDKTVAMLRSFVQENTNLQVLVTGSEQHTLLALKQHKNPFWKQLQEVLLGPVDLNEFCDEYQVHYGFRVPKAARDILEAEVSEHTMQLVHVLNICRTHLRGATKAKMTEAIELAIEDNIGEYDRIIRKNLTTSQRKVLFALAKDRPNQPLSQTFLKANGLGAAPTVKRTLDKLVDMEVLDQERRFIDPLLRRFIATSLP